MSLNVQTMPKTRIAPGASQLGPHHIEPEREGVGSERVALVKAHCGTVDSEGGQ